MELSKIRNFCIIAHIDHGKSTLADRLLELTKTVPQRAMREQVLDQMELERERGITIKLAPVTMSYNGYLLNLIDTPGHVDFSYEVSRSLACVEGVILLVDASQGIQAQTVANLHLAQSQNLVIIPVINKIDLPNANIEATKQELASLLKISDKEILSISAKSGKIVPELLNRLVRDIPAPKPSSNKLQALIFDSRYDEWRGVVASIRLVAGEIKKGDRYWLPGGKINGEVLEVGIYQPQLKPQSTLVAGQIGYLITGLKNINKVRVGDTFVSSEQDMPLSGYQQVKPMVFAGFYPREGDEATELREGLDKLKLNDASLSFEPEHSPALGFGFRVGFLGLLHLEITKERLEREYELELVITSPSVAYRVQTSSGVEKIIKSALELPNESTISQVTEPIMLLDIVAPNQYLGKVMTLAQESHAEWKATDYLLGPGGVPERAILHYQIPLSSILFDFYDRLKSVSQGYASLNYDFLEYRPCQIKRLDILVAEEIVESLATIVYTSEAYHKARSIVTKLKEIIPRQMFEVKIQAALGGKIIAAERLSAMRKDVTAKLYGGDVTRKRKLLEKQKKGKKRMRAQGSVQIPTEAYLSLLSRPTSSRTKALQ
ncbi:MAG: translation elongation factor 4 [Patescibacteria group bacterium]